MRSGGPVALLLVALTLGCAGGGGGGPAALTPAEVTFAPELGIDLSQMEQTRSGLYVQELEVGRGAAAQRESLVTLRYIGWLPDGSVIDAAAGGDTYQVRLGGNEVIRGWNEGIRGMRIGGRRLLVIPPRLGYGSRGTARIPSNSTLIFNVELVDVR